MNAWSRFEYVSLRLIRKFLMTEKVANRFAAWIPHYRSSINETSPGTIVSAYADALSQAGLGLAGQSVLEVGAGRTNAVAYGLAAAGASEVLVLEPFVAYDATRDIALLRENHAGNEKGLQQRVGRSVSFDDVPERSVDIILSNSVLEHVLELEPFFASCRRVLRPGGGMLHMVDYRDHFFKYPYGFLTFTSRTWSRWLDPGDLPRWRLSDHAGAMRRAGFQIDVVTRDTMAEDFAAVRDCLAPPFADGDEDVAVTYAVIHGHLPQ